MKNKLVAFIHLALALLLGACQPSAAPASPPPWVTASAAQTQTLQGVDTTLTLGEANGQVLRPLLGVNVGPAPSGDAGNPDLTEAYRAIGVTLIRTHDFYGPLDMAVMYPDRLRDPADPASYEFQASDAQWQAIVQGGFEPYFRLGDSWNNATPPANAAERANWVNAAIAVVRHYRQGQWDGFTTPFRYVEIWNEPDNTQFWPHPHTPEAFNQLYVEAALALKQAFPDLIVGGPGVTPAGALAPHGQKWVRAFLDAVKQQGAPLDFFSWHLYANEPSEWAGAAQFYRRELDERGFQAVAQHVTEWNTAVEQSNDKGPEARALRTGGKGAAILTAAWIAMQQNGVTEALFYRGPDPSMNLTTFYGMFYANGQPKRIAQAFPLWKQLAAHPQQLTITATPETGLWLLAGQNESGEIALLVANPTQKVVRYRLVGIESSSGTLLQIDDDGEHALSLPPGEPEAVLLIGAETVQLLVLSP
ncbi:MAG: GH39 family glycosyl hydrolase [Chloroflexota bacterium]